MSEQTEHPKKAGFLAALAESCNVCKACELAGIGRTAVYEWRKADTEFAQAWESALEIGADLLEDEAVRRGHEGYDEPVFYQGVQTATTRKYSDTLLIFLLKAAKPDKYRERISTELTGKGGGPVELTDLDRASRVSALMARRGLGGTGLAPVGGSVGAAAGTADASAAKSG